MKPEPAAATKLTDDEMLVATTASLTEAEIRSCEVAKSFLFPRRLIAPGLLEMYLGSEWEAFLRAQKKIAEIV